MLGYKLGFVVMAAQQILAHLMVDEPDYAWHPANGKQIACSSPLRAGWGQNHSPIYIGRAWYNGDLLPAKAMPARSRAYVGINGKEFWNTTYEVLCGRHAQWVFDSNGHIPKNAFPVGATSEGNVLYYGRANFMDGLHAGKLEEGQEGILIPYKGKEYLLYIYEVLVTGIPSAPDEGSYMYE